MIRGRDRPSDRRSCTRARSSARARRSGPFCIVGEHVTIGERTQAARRTSSSTATRRSATTATFYPFCSIGTAVAGPQVRRRASPTRRSATARSSASTASIHRATGEGETTVVGDDCLLLAYVHIAHNCRDRQRRDDVEPRAARRATSIVDDNASIGGMAGAHQFVRIGAYAIVGGRRS